MIVLVRLIVHRRQKRILPPMNHLQYPTTNRNRYLILIHHLVVVVVVIVTNHRNDLDMIAVMMIEIVDSVGIIIDDHQIDQAIPIIRKNQSMNESHSMLFVYSFFFVSIVVDLYSRVNKSFQ